MYFFLKNPPFFKGRIRIESDPLRFKPVFILVSLLRVKWAFVRVIGRLTQTPESKVVYTSCETSQHSCTKNTPKKTRQPFWLCCVAYWQTDGGLKQKMYRRQNLRLTNEHQLCRHFNAARKKERKKEREKKEKRKKNRHNHPRSLSSE